jgi:hypothetical protein
VVISRSHQTRMSLSQRSHKNGSAKSVCGAGDCKLTQDRTTDSAGRRPVSQVSQALLAALHHSRLLPPCPRCHRNIHDRHQTSTQRVCCPVACSIAQIASPSHPSAIAADQSLRDSQRLAGFGQWEAVCKSLRTRLGHGLAKGFTAGGFSLRAPSGRPQALPSFYTASMRLLNGILIASVGSVTICAWSFVRGLTLDLTLSALAALALQKLASRASP